MRLGSHYTNPYGEAKAPRKAVQYPRNVHLYGLDASFLEDSRIRSVLCIWQPLDKNAIADSTRTGRPLELLKIGEKKDGIKLKSTDGVCTGWRIAWWYFTLASEYSGMTKEWSGDDDGETPKRPGEPGRPQI